MDGDNILENILETFWWIGNGDGMTTMINLMVFLTIPTCTVVIQVSLKVRIVGDTENVNL